MRPTAGSLRLCKRFSMPIASAALFLGIWLFPQHAFADSEIEFRGLLGGLPSGGLVLPPPSPFTADIDLPIERGASVLTFDIVFTPATEVELVTPLARNNDLVKVKLDISAGTLQVAKIEEAEIAEVRGTLTGLSPGGLPVPVSTNTTVTILVGGLASIPLDFVITPFTEVDPQTLVNGQGAKVELTSVAAQLTALELENEDDDDGD